MFEIFLIDFKQINYECFGEILCVVYGYLYSWLIMGDEGRFILI